MNTLSLRTFLAAGALLLCGLAPCTAHADPLADAKDLFARGRELRAQGHCDAAVDVFRKAHELYPAGLGSLRNIAECEEELGRFASARRAWLDMKRALVGNGDAKYDGWTQDAELAAARLAPKLATLVVELSAKTPTGQRAPVPPGISVTLNGETLAPALVGTPLERDPGHYMARAQGPEAKAPVERSVDLSAGEAKRVTLEWVVQPHNEAPRSARGSGDGQGTRRALGWTAVALGAASLGGALASFAVRQSALSQIDEQCSSHVGCPSALEPTAARGQTASALATVFAVTAGAALAGGIVLLATGSSHSRMARFLLEPGRSGAAARWTF